MSVTRKTVSLDSKWELFPRQYRGKQNVGFIPTTAILARMSSNVSDKSGVQKTPATVAQPPTVLVKAVCKLLRPLVKLLIRHQITYPFLINLLKSLYVEVAEQEFRVDARRQSDSRINLLTGVHRKDVKRLRNEDLGAQELPSNISTGARLIAYWLGSKEFLDKAGNPLPLTLRSNSKPTTPSFDDLVEHVCKQDIRPRVVLDDWLHLGIAHQDEHGRIILNTGAFTPDSGFDEKVFFFGKNLHDHISASTHNLSGGHPPFFDRSVYYDRLSQASVEELAALADQAGMQALRALNTRALALQQRDRQNSDANARKIGESYRINFGVFNYNTCYRSDSDSGNPVSETRAPEGPDNA